MFALEVSLLDRQRARSHLHRRPCLPATEDLLRLQDGATEAEETSRHGISIQAFSYMHMRRREGMAGARYGKPLVCCPWGAAAQAIANRVVQSGASSTLS